MTFNKRVSSTEKEVPRKNQRVVHLLLLTRYIDVLARIGASKRADNETAAHGVFRHVRALARVLGAYVVSLDRLLRERDAVARQLDGKRRRAENDALDADDVANRRLSKGNIRTN